MTTEQFDAQPPETPPTHRDAPRSRLVNALVSKPAIGAYGFLIGLIFGAAIGGADTDDTATPSPTATVTVTTEPTATPTVTATTTTTALATVTAPPPGPEVAFSDGVWLVGEDIEPGRYRTIEEVSDGCYWEISQVGGDIIDNDLPSGGRPTVTLDDGQEFTSNRCGDWAMS